MSLFKGAVLAIICIALAGCGHTPVSSMVKLRKFDPITSDVTKMSVAVAVPRAFKVAEDGVILTVSMEKEDGSDGQTEMFALSNSLDLADQREILLLAEPGKQILAYRVDRADYERFNQIRKYALERKGTKGWKGSFGIGTKVCRLSKALPKDIKITTYLKSAETSGYVPLLVDVDIMKYASESDIETHAPLCSKV